MRIRRGTSACRQVREQVSARWDGEPIDAAPVDDHLAGCAECRAYADALPGLSAQIAASPNAMVPDLTPEILATVATDQQAARARRNRELRWLAGLAGAAQFVLALPLLLGLTGSIAHLDRHLGVAQLAIGVGLIMVAWQPGRAAGVFPIVAVVTALGLVTGVVDVTAGRVAWHHELTHLIEGIGALALWSLARRSPRAGPMVTVRSLG